MREVLASSVLYLFAAALSPQVYASPSYINGQTFTDGLLIIDAPSPNSPGHAGSTLPIAVDVSGDGQLPPSASTPGSGKSTNFELVQIYLTSQDSNFNLTVTSDPTFLTNESGSTVKHLNWMVPTCVPSGNYNLTFYESSTFQGQSVFAITPIPLPIQNPNPSGTCQNLNTFLAAPQASRPLNQSPFAPGFTLTLTLSDGSLALPTVTVTGDTTPTTVVMLSLTTVTQTSQGSVETFTETSTYTTAMSRVSGDTSQDTSGFIPVNASDAGYAVAPSLFSFLVSVASFLSVCLGVL